ncbi:MAG: hypothetical protein OXT67_04925 [Zetaproteobacteria bacterium]|nr:hypothetical protein [Zetaproteobacteria bacterium]
MQRLASHSFSLLLFSLLCALPGHSGNDRPQIAPIPPAPLFVVVDSAYDRPLGSAYFPPFESVGYLDKHPMVLCHLDDSSEIAVRQVTQQNNFILFKLRQKEQRVDVGVHGDLQLQARRNLGEAMLYHHTQTKTDDQSISLDLSVLFSPRHDVIDRSQTKFANIVELYPYQGSFFNYYCKVRKPRRGLMETYTYSCEGPAKEFRPAYDSATEMLKLCGTSVIYRHYYGVTLIRSIMFQFGSKEARANFESKLAAKLCGNLAFCMAHTQASSYTELTSALIDTKVSVDVRNQNSNFSKLMQHLSQCGYTELVEEYYVNDGALLAASGGSAIQAMDAAFALLQTLNRIEKVVTELDVGAAEEIFQVVAVSPGTHSQCVSRAHQELATNIQVPLNLAWNAVTGNQQLWEKKQKDKKVRHH